MQSPPNTFARDLVALRAWMLQADLTYRELGHAIGLSSSRVHSLLHSPSPTANERTVHKIARYVDARRSRLRPRRKRVAR